MASDNKEPKFTISRTKDDIKMFAGVDEYGDEEVDLDGPEMDMLMKVTQSDLYKLAFNRDGWEYGFQ